MAKLYTAARMTTATTGTGTITLGSAVSGYLSFAGAGIANGDTVYYGIQDGTNGEWGYGVYTSSGTTLTRNVIKSTNSNSAISLSGSAQVFITPIAASQAYLLGGASLIGAARNLKITKASNTTLTVTYDQVCTANSLTDMAVHADGNGSYTFNSGTTGANGMDTGSAPTSGYVAIYAICKDDGSSFALLGQNTATLPGAPTIYGGSHLPSGYSASALIGIWPTDSSGNFLGGLITDRAFRYQTGNYPFFKNNITSASPASTSVSAGVPPGARYASFGIGSTINHGGTYEFASDSSGTAGVFISHPSGGLVGGATINGVSSMFVEGLEARVPITTSQQIYFGDVSGGGITSLYGWVTGYEW